MICLVTCYLARSSRCVIWERKLQLSVRIVLNGFEVVLINHCKCHSVGIDNSSEVTAIYMSGMQISNCQSGIIKLWQVLGVKSVSLGKVVKVTGVSFWCKFLVKVFSVVKVSGTSFWYKFLVKVSGTSFW